MAKSPDEVRFDRRVAATIVAFLGTVMIGPATSCLCIGGHFSSAHLVVTLIVLAWGLFALATYRNRRERIIGWIAFAVASFAWFLEWSGNSIHLFRTRDIIGIMDYLGF